MTNIDVSYPLHWPEGWKRSKMGGVRSAFARSRTLAAARIFLLEELRRLGARLSSVVISSNVLLRADGLPRSGQAQPVDRGAAVYFELKDRKQVLACDRWDRVEDNLYAIGKHIEAIRAQERYGVGTVEQALAGYLALPPAASAWEILGLQRGASAEEVNRAFRELARTAHPDQGGTHEQMARLTAARQELLAQVHGGQP